MASKRQPSITTETLRWNILEMIALEEELESDVRRPENRERDSLRLDFLRSESLQQVGELKVELEAWSRGDEMTPSSVLPVAAHAGEAHVEPRGTARVGPRRDLATSKLTA